MGARSGLWLRDFRAGDVPAVEPWFDDLDTERWLGGRDWPSMVLRASATLPRARTFLACRAGRPLVLLGFDVEEDGRAGISYVTNPQARRRGHATAVLRLMLPLAAQAGARCLVAGVEAGNASSEALLRRLGFRPQGPCDADGFSYFILPLSGAPAMRSSPVVRHS